MFRIQIIAILFFLSLTTNVLSARIDVGVGGGGSGSVSDAIYGAGWDGDTTVAPSKNAVYDQIETIASGGDNITVNTTGATNANFLDNLYIDWAIDTVATPDDVTAKYNYALTLAGNHAFAVDECAIFADATGGGFICEGSTADTSEQLYRIPDVNGVDTTSYFMLDDTSITSIDDVSLEIAAGVLRRAALTGDVTASAGGNVMTIAADAVALTTDTTGNYAAGDAEAGAALTGDTATLFFSVGTVEDARLPASMADKVMTGSLALPQGTAPTVDAAGEAAVDTTDDQFIYYGAAKRVLPYERTICAVIENLAAADDSFAFYMANDAITVTGVGCNCRGTCTTAATFTLEDRGGNAMTITGTNPTCATTGAATFAAVTTANQLTAGEMVAFDVTNAVSPETDEYSLCITYTMDGS